MKNLKSLLIALSLLTLSNVTRANENDQLNIKELREKMKQSITTPESIRQKKRSEKITVLFVVNEEGRVIEANAECKDARTKEELEKQFLNLRLVGLKACVINSVEMSFLVF